MLFHTIQDNTIIKHMFRRYNTLRHSLISIIMPISIFVFVGSSTVAFASPFGAGNYGANVPYGGPTSLTISTNGNVSISVTPSDSGTLATGDSVVTVTSADVVGFKLYVRAFTNTNLVNGASTVAASANVLAAPLAVNTWGYNTDASTNFAGITLSDVLIRTATGPYTSGDQTTIRYGIKIDNAKASGNYQTTIVYTAVPQTQ